MKLVLFQEIVKILLQHLEDEAGVVLMREALVGPHKVKLVGIFLAKNKIHYYIKFFLPNIKQCNVIGR